MPAMIVSVRLPKIERNHGVAITDKISIEANLPSGDFDETGGIGGQLHPKFLK